jgi:peptidyl-prolyl cis-trans isomerase C
MKNNTGFKIVNVLIGILIAINIIFLLKAGIARITDGMRTRAIHARIEIVCDPNIAADERMVAAKYLEGKKRNPEWNQHRIAIEIALGNWRYCVKQGAESAPVLCQFLKTGNPDIQKCLVEIGSPSVPSLIAMLNSGSKETNALVMDLLVQIGQPAVSPLIQVAMSSNSDLQSYTADGLAKIGPSSVWPLVDKLKDPDEQKCKIAAQILTRIGQPAFSMMIEEMIAKSAKRNEIADAFIRIGQPAEAFIVDLMSRKSPDVRMMAAEIWLQIQHRSSLPLKIANSDNETRKKLFTELAALGKPAVMVLSDFMNDDNAQTRVAAAESLVSIGGASVDALISIERAEWNASEALARIGSDALPALLEGLKSDKAEIRNRCALVLARMGESAVSCLYDAYRQDDAFVPKEYILDILSNIAEKDIEALTKIRESVSKSDIELFESNIRDYKVRHFLKEAKDRVRVSQYVYSSQKSTIAGITNDFLMNELFWSDSSRYIAAATEESQYPVIGYIAGDPNNPEGIGLAFEHPDKSKGIQYILMAPSGDTQPVPTAILSKVKTDLESRGIADRTGAKRGSVMILTVKTIDSLSKKYGNSLDVIKSLNINLAKLHGDDYFKTSILFHYDLPLPFAGDGSDFIAQRIRMCLGIKTENRSRMSYSPVWADTAGYITKISEKAQKLAIEIGQPGKWDTDVLNVSNLNSCAVKAGQFVRPGQLLGLTETTSLQSALTKTYEWLDFKGGKGYVKPTFEEPLQVPVQKPVAVKTDKSPLANSTSPIRTNVKSEPQKTFQSPQISSRASGNKENASGTNQYGSILDNVSGSDSNKVLVSVNGNDITEAEVSGQIDRRMTAIMKAAGINYPADDSIKKKMNEELRDKFLDSLIDKILVAEQLKINNINVTDADVETKFLEAAKETGKDIKELEQAIEKIGMTLEDIKKEIYWQVGMEKLYIAKTGNTSVDDTDVQKYYNKNTKSFEQSEQVQVSHILVKTTGANDAQKAEARKKIEGLLKDAKAGKDFAELARTNSDCPSKQKGGDLGFFGRGQMVKSFEDAAFGLKNIGDISDIVETQFGYHIIKMKGRKDAKKSDMNEVKVQIKTKLDKEKLMQFWKEYSSQLRENAQIEWSPEEKARRSQKQQIP